MDARGIAAVARGAGFTGDALTTAVAIALAESGGNPTAHNGVPPDDSYGLWQINMIGNLGPIRRQQLGISSNQQLYDPAINARAAYGISGAGTNFAPWSTYNNGQAAAKLAEAQAGVDGKTVPDSSSAAGAQAVLLGWHVPTPGDIAGAVAGAAGSAGKAIAGAAGSALSPITSSVQILATIGRVLLSPDLWLRLAMVLGGAILVLVGIALLHKDSIAATLKNVAGKAAVAA